MTREQAERISKEYQHLVGEKFSDKLDEQLLIQCVTVAPYRDTDKYIFIVQYKDCNDLENALKMYSGEDYDVVLITQFVSDKKEVLFTDLRSWLLERNIVYDKDDIVYDKDDASNPVI